MKPFGRADTRNFLPSHFESGLAGRRPAPLPRHHAIGCDAGIAVEWGWCSWHEATADRLADLRHERDASRLWRGILVGTLLTVALSVGVAVVVRAAVAHPHAALVAALTLTGIGGVLLSLRGRDDA